MLTTRPELRVSATLASLPTLMRWVTSSVASRGFNTDITQGKTTTTERMLYHSGVTRHLGSMLLGNAPGYPPH